MLNSQKIKHLLFMNLRIILLFLLYFLLIGKGYSKDERDQFEYILQKHLSTIHFSASQKKGVVRAQAKVRENKWLLSKKKTKTVDYVDYVLTNTFSEVSSYRVNKVTATGKSGGGVRHQATKDRYKSSSLFHDDYFVNVYAFALEANKGYETLYEKTYLDAKFLTSAHFYSGPETEERVIEIVKPEGYSINVTEVNFDGYEIEKSIDKDKFGRDIIIYTLRNMPEIERDNYSADGRFYLPHLRFNLESVKVKGEEYDYMSDLQDMYNWYHELSESVENDNSVLEDKVDELTGSAQSEMEKLNNIYVWVQENIKYIAFEDGIAGFKPDNCQNVYNNKYGDCKGMANLIKEMCGLAGFDARLAWIGTQNRVPYDYSIPNLENDNHMICAVIDADTIIYLDGTERFTDITELSFRIQGRPVLIEDGDQYILTQVPQQAYDQQLNEIKSRVYLDLGIDALQFDYSFTMQGERKRRLGYYYSYIASKNQEKLIDRYFRQKESDVIEPSLVQISQRDEDLKVDFKYTSYNQVINLEDEYYLDINTYKDYEALEITEERLSDWQFSRRVNDITEVEFKIPEGYEVTFVPEDISVSNQYFTVYVKYVVQADNTLSLVSEIRIPEGYIPLEFHDEWYSAIRQLQKNYEEKVIIKKI